MSVASNENIFTWSFPFSLLLKLPHFSIFRFPPFTNCDWLSCYVTLWKNTLCSHSDGLHLFQSQCNLTRVRNSLHCSVNTPQPYIHYTCNYAHTHTQHSHTLKGSNHMYKYVKLHIYICTLYLYLERGGHLASFCPRRYK